MKRASVLHSLMTPNTQQVFPWAEDFGKAASCSPARPAAERGCVPPDAPEALADRDFPETQSELFKPPVASPLPGAVAAGVFGLEISGPLEPDAEQVAALVDEHAHELRALLNEAEALREAIRSGTDPHSGRLYRDAHAAAQAAERRTVELRRVESNYTDALAAYEEGFGSEAAQRLDEWVRRQTAGGGRRQADYEPGHPWHYYSAGDNATPIPFEQIKPCDEAGSWLESTLPKNPAKRAARMRELLEQEQLALARDREVYEAVISRGAEALSRYDREIAYGGNDELARAGTLALKYNHIRLGLGRIAWLRACTGGQQGVIPGAGAPPMTSSTADGRIQTT